jgi:Effector-associated domain 1
MLWIHSPDWSDATAQGLHDTLAKALYLKADLIEVWVDIGMDPATVYWEIAARQLWPALTRDAAAADRLERLILQVRKRRPALAREFDSVLKAELVTDSWYVCANPFMSRLVGPGRRLAVLDRYGLRAGIIDVAQQDFPVLAIRGRSGSGRSYSRRVLQHVAQHPDTGFDLITVDAVELRNPAGATELLGTLAARLGIPATFDIDIHTEANRKAREMVTALVGRFRQLPRMNRWIFLDSLDRPHVQPDLHTAVGHMASEIEAGQLGPTRLVVTGHPGDFAPEVMDVLIQETIAEISESEVRAFFREVADDIGRALEEEELDYLVSEVTARAGTGDLRALGRSASDVAHMHFGGAR